MKNVRNLTYGAMIVGLISIALFFDRATSGMLSPMLSLPIAIPIIVYGIIFGMRDSVAVYIVSIIVSFLFSGMLPSMLMVVGYGGTALIYIYAYSKQLSNTRKNILMVLGLVLFYWIMIQFFGEYFGVSIPDTITFLSRIFPGLGASLFKFLAYFTVALTLLSEVVLINIASSFMIVRLRLNVEK